MAPGNEGETFAGRVWLGDDGRVAAVTRAGDPAPSGFGTARVVEAGEAFVYPGLIDLHSHLAYNSLPLWVDPLQATPYLHRDIWPGEKSYGPEISWTAWTLLTRAPETLLAYAQVRALAGGTTAIQGWPALSRNPANKLVRSVDNDAVGPLTDPVLVSTLTLKAADLARRAAQLRDGRILVYHCAEGQPGTRVARDFDDLATAGCLQPGLVAIHCTALDRSHFDRWRAAAGHTPGGAVVWSPLSNLWLYGVTSDVPGALGAG
ncbi:MAG: amidohydrolase family protein, partial [Acidimicrobiales bacterium]